MSLKLYTQFVPSSTDLEWDRFVDQCTYDAIEQTSGWAKAKSRYGWACLRTKAIQGDHILGGCQILYKNLLGGIIIGYLPRGPLLTHISPINSNALLETILYEVKRICKEKRIAFLIAQPTDTTKEIEDMYLSLGFQQEKISGIVKATALIDLRKSEIELLCGMTKSYQRYIGYAARRGAILEEGFKSEIPIFYQLMLETCRRQKVKPNPSDVHFFFDLWDTFAPKKQVRLFFAVYNRKAISGMFVIARGGIFRNWKVGWSGEYPEIKPNHFIHWEIIKRAKSEGFLTFDFTSIERNTAEQVLAGKNIHSVASGPTLFKLRFGAKVQLLPNVYYYIKNPVLSSLYSQLQKVLITLT